MKEKEEGKEKENRAGRALAQSARGAAKPDPRS
jgi:hypothetical protein